MGESQRKYIHQIINLSSIKFLIFGQMKFLIKNMPDFMEKNYIINIAKNAQDFENLLK